MVHGRGMITGCYQPLRNDYSALVRKVEGDYETVKVELPDDATVEDFITSLVKQIGMPLLSVPYLTLSKCRESKRFKIKQKKDAIPTMNQGNGKEAESELKTSRKGNESQLKTSLGLPFFARLADLKIASQKLYLRINLQILPRGQRSMVDVLGDRGAVILIHQVLTEIATSFTPNYFQKRIEWVNVGLIFLSKLLKGAMFERIKLKYYNIIHRQDFPLIVHAFRILFLRRRAFLAVANKTYKDDYSYYTRRQTLDNDKFFHHVCDLNPERHPFHRLKEIWSDDDCVNNEAVLLYQLDRLVWRPDKKLTVYYFKSFAVLQTRELKRPISDKQFAYLVRYLSVCRPGIECYIANSENKLERIDTKLNVFCRDYDVCYDPMKYCNNSNCQKFEFDTKPDDFGGRGHYCYLKRRTENSKLYRTSNFRTLEETTPRFDVDGEGDSVSDNGDQTRYVIEPQKEHSWIKDKTLMPTSVCQSYIQMPQPLLVVAKPSYDRRLDIPTGYEDSITNGNWTTVKKYIHGENCWAVKSLRDELVRPLKDKQAKSQKDNEKLKKRDLICLAESIRIAYDFYDPAWCLHPAIAIRLELILSSISEWAKFGSLKRLLASQLLYDFTVRHWLQIASQLSVALDYLTKFVNTTLDFDFGVHPYNVLVMDFNQDAIFVRLGDRGIRKPQSGDKKSCISKDLPKNYPVDMVNLCETLYSSIPNEDFTIINMIRKALIDWLHTFPELIMVVRRFLTDPALKDEVERVIISKNQEPSILTQLQATGNWESSKTTERLGCGHFGEVYRVTVNDKKYAVKKLKSNAEKEKSKGLGEEAKLMKSLHHEHVISFVDWDPDQELIAMEFAEGGCLLKKMKSDWEKRKPLREDEKWRYSFEICRGMAYLHSKNILHRDLACRNILLQGKEPFIVKITDFGLSRHLQDGIYEKMSTKELPVYWLPPNLRNNAVSLKLDVWSFGVCMWEIFTNGDSPLKFYGRPDNLYERVFVEGKYLPNHRVDSPDKKINESAYRIMCDNCWLKDEAERKSFDQLEPLLKEHVPCKT